MVYLEKSQPAPASLAVEKQKANGDYKKEDVLERLKAEEKQSLLSKIGSHISRDSHFTAFKRWIIKDDPKLNRKFGEYID
jgi:hypothetical protein